MCKTKQFDTHQLWLLSCDALLFNLNAPGLWNTTAPLDEDLLNKFCNTRVFQLLQWTYLYVLVLSSQMPQMREPTIPAMTMVRPILPAFTSSPCTVITQRQYASSKWLQPTTSQGQKCEHFYQRNNCAFMFVLDWTNITKQTNKNCLTFHVFYTGKYSQQHQSDLKV